MARNEVRIIIGKKKKKGLRIILYGRCHRESGTPDFLYPRTEFTSEYGTPVHDSLVNCVWGYRIPVGYFVSPYVSPPWILYPPTDSTTTLRRSSRNVSANDLESWENGQLFL